MFATIITDSLTDFVSHQQAHLEKDVATIRICRPYSYVIRKGLLNLVINFFSELTILEFTISQNTTVTQNIRSNLLYSMKCLTKFTNHT